MGFMDKDVAKQLMEALRRCHADMDAAEVLARAISDPTEQMRIRDAIMQAGGVLYTEVMFGIISEYPDLDPYPTSRRREPEGN